MLSKHLPRIIIKKKKKKINEFSLNQVNVVQLNRIFDAEYGITR